MCSVLVTGGAGFLGQHVVGLLQTRADHVTEVRVLDIIPYENKLDYVHKKPLKCYVGSITDESLLKETCRGVQSVIHIAAVADSTIFPNSDRVREVNVQGTLVTLLTALQTSGVKRFINCSSTSIGMGYDSDTSDLIRESDPVPKHFIFEPYAPTKLIAEKIVSSANSESFRTVSLRPLAMYGEQDIFFITAAKKMAAPTFNTCIAANCNGVRQQQVYVGNVAWAFVCAEKTLYQEMLQKGVKPQSEEIIAELCDTLRRRAKSESIRLLDGDVKSADLDNDVSTDNVFNIVDDKPPQDLFEFERPFLKQSGCRLFPVLVPLSALVWMLYVFYYVLRLVRVFSPKANYPVSAGALKFLKKPYIFCDKKARERLGYKPLFTPEEAEKRSMVYYKQLSYS